VFRFLKFNISLTDDPPGAYVIVYFPKLPMYTREVNFKGESEEFKRPGWQLKR
jgi:hypothetical protein